MERIILVDKDDREIGSGEKLEVHQKGLLHRAFSINILNSKGQLLLQQRAKTKYHSGGLWTNTCCSHPRVDEKLENAVHRRLKEEMGFDTEVRKVFTMVYKAPFSNGLTEHEFLHVYLGQYNKDPKPNPAEVGGWKWMSFEDVKDGIANHPEMYTYWFKKFYPKLKSLQPQA